MRDLLVVLHPRSIEECVGSIAALPIDKAWLTGYTEPEIEGVFPDLVEDTDYDRYIAVSDDVVVVAPALAAVRRLLGRGHPVVTGWTNVDTTPVGRRLSNIVQTPFAEYETNAYQYDWLPIEKVMRSGPAIPTPFAGMCLTGMSREMWRKYPFRTYNGKGYSSDFELSWRLQEDEVPIIAARDGGVFHVKERNNVLDRDPRKRLLVGEFEPHVRMEPWS